MIIHLDDFSKVDIRVGVIIDVQDFPEAKKSAYKLTVDFGSEIGLKRSSAQITENYTRDQLKGKKILAVVNLGSRQIGPFVSEVLVLGTTDNRGAVMLADPGLKAVLGARLL